MITISENLNDFVVGLFPDIEENLKLSQMGIELSSFIAKATIFAAILALNFSVVAGLALLRYNLVLFVIPVYIVFFIGFFVLSMSIPKLSIYQIRQDIESDIFIPSRMLLTLLESGNSLISALISVSYTKAKSSKYFGKIASEIMLGENIEQAIDNAIRNTPSESFRRVLEPIKKSLRIGTDIQKSLSATLDDLSKETIIEIEEYEKKLSPVSMFYMIFGAVIPVLGVVAVVSIISILGLNVEFFPFLFILLVLIFFVQLFFILLFKQIRPLVRL